ncbi:2TM domain-containing protein [Aestuariibaculum sediminum]|uniref:2TM domain-containing protein n=1 Tax=Aestuariibaculum sediminum TaxID=2770637 RepID=A0A8J6Q1N1_9FLAO|nr:2TM domain-containing protein [Aestuariibaculum sediminum]MBD0833137.1 2TM domain-containing protein [Aestuariibaculum sediminum]
MPKTIKNIIITFFIGCAIFFVGNYIEDGLQFSNRNEVILDFAFYQLYAFVIGYSNMFFFGYLEKRNWKKTDSIKRILVGIVGSVVVTVLDLFVLRASISVVVYGNSFNQFLTHERFSYYGFGLIITLIIVVIFHLIYFYNRYQQNRIKEQKVIAGTASAKFDALKNQLDPHFLFNSLNVLTSLIDENPENAQKFTTALSKIYRYVLEQKNKELVSVDEELNFARTYMSLLKMRFEDSIVFKIPQQASNPDFKVVPLSLQLLLENAVKHNMVTVNKPLHINIFEDENYLVVENNLQPKQIVKKSSGVGLSNIMQRYKLLTNRKLNINQEANRFAVAIPMLSKQISVMRTSNQTIDDNYVRARKHVEELKGFYYNLFSYCLVIPFLIFVNYRTSWQFQWFWFPMLGWALGLSIQGFRVFVNDKFFGRNWEKRKMEQFMTEEERANWN